VNPDAPAADRFEDRLLVAILDDHANLTAAAGAAAPPSAFQSSPARHAARRLVPAVVATAVVAGVAVAGVAANDAHGQGHGHATSPTVTSQRVTPAVKAGGPVMDLASYRLRLPSNYRLTKTTDSSCPVEGVGFSSPSHGHAGASSSTANVPGYATQLVAAANAEGACLYAVLAPPYTPTAADPDPEAGTYESSPPVQVGPYEGRAGTWTAVAKPSGATSQQAALYVELPVAGGQMQDLAVSSYGLSEPALISLVADGLTTAGSSPTGSTTTAG
jgi:hypothetical protein